MSETVKIPDDIREAAINLSDTITVERWVSPQSKKLQDWQTMMIERALLAERKKERERAAKVAENMADEWVGENGGGACDAVAEAIRSGE